MIPLTIPTIEAGNGNEQNFQGVFSRIFRPGGYFTGSFEF